LNQAYKGLREKKKAQLLEKKSKTPTGQENWKKKKKKGEWSPSLCPKKKQRRALEKKGAKKRPRPTAPEDSVQKRTDKKKNQSN